MNDELITLAHGDGGEKTNKLIHDIFVKAFKHEDYAKFDAAMISFPSAHIAITTDSFVVQPLEFPGGNIGKLAVAGTVNDLAVSKATPMWLTAGFIIEEGLPIKTLEKIVTSMAEEARKANVVIVAGDTKVVENGACDQIFINTTGIGIYQEKPNTNPSFCEGDLLLVNGTIGDHGMALMTVREGLPISSNLESDCASLNSLIEPLLEKFGEKIKFMRDATRGGLASTLIEICEDFHVKMNIIEENIPIDVRVQGACSLLGYDPLFVANEGKVVMVVDKEVGNEVLSYMKTLSYGERATIIGSIKDTNVAKGMLTLTTPLNVEKKVQRLSSIQLPRIC